MGEETALAETGLGTSAVDLLCELIALDTVSPPGNEDRAQDLLSERLRDAGSHEAEIGFAHARELLAAVRDRAAGVYVVAPYKKPLSVLELLT